VRFLGQAVVVPVAIELFVLTGMLVIAGVFQATPYVENVITIVLLAAIGYLGGLLVARLDSSLVASGRWTWIPAVGLFMVGLVSDLSVLPQYYGGSWWAVIAMSLHEKGGDEGARVIFGTYPACVAVAYSLAMFTSRREGKTEQNA
jgi:hypothetical protein